jgi:rare lipoprotein A (peptidoglycan hydrolase)
VIGAVIAAILVVAIGVAVPLQMIPPKKEEAEAMIAPPPPKRPPEYGVASWYGDHEAGLRTASGAAFRPDALTAAHRWLPLGTKVKVTRLGTKRSTVVTINDRGPFIGGRLIDLSPAAARQLAMVDKGVARVRVDVLEVPHNAEPPREARHAKKHTKAKSEELANQPGSPAPAPAEVAKPTPAEAAQQTKPVDARPAAAEPDSLNHFP